MTFIPDNVPRSKVVANLDWLRSPHTDGLTPYQQYIRDFSWSKTALGPIQTWPRELHQTVLFMMAETDPVILYWGEQLTMIYNQSSVPLIGKQHPLAQGTSAVEVFPKSWVHFADIVDKQRLTGEASAGEASMLLMERHGFVEETYFNWKLIPVIGEDGILLGSYGRPTESSEIIINSRRNICIQNFTRQINATQSFDALWRGAIDGLSQNDKDIPVAMLYSVESSHFAQDIGETARTICRLEALLGIPWEHSSVRKELDLQKDLDSLGPYMLEALTQGSACSIQLSDAGLNDLFADIEWRGFGVPIKTLVFLPINTNGVISALLVVGLNPYLQFNNTYLEFIQLIGDNMSQQIAKLKPTQQVCSRDHGATTSMLGSQNNAAMFSLFAERSPVSLILTDIDGKITYGNAAWYQFRGSKKIESDLPKWVEAISEKDLPLIHEWWHSVTKLKQSGTCQVCLNEPYINGDKRLPHRTASVAAFPNVNANEDVETVMLVVSDTSELTWTQQQLHQCQNELEASEKKYRDFAEHAPIGVVRTDAHGYVQFANKAWRSFYNFDHDHHFSEPEPWLTSLNKEDVAGASQYFKEMCQTKTSGTIQVRLDKRKGVEDVNRATPTEFWLLSSGFVETKADGSIDNAIFWVTDISDQKAAEKILTDKMEEAIRLKNTQERFVDMISHEIRNPLSAILHCSEEIVEAMKNWLNNTEQAQTLELVSAEEVASQSLGQSQINSALDAANTILYCVQHQKQIVDDVLTLSKLDADLLIVSPVPVQPTELLRTALKIFEPELKASSIELSFEIQPSLQQLNVDWVMLDSNRFLQIVINLVTNAIKFTRNSQTKRILISVTARQTKPSQRHEGVHYIPRKREAAIEMLSDTADNDIDQANPNDFYLCFSVADTGKGLTEDERTILFNRFAQASPKTHIEYGGSGLGLFIARQITEMLGGEIGVGSEPGKGAVFAFYVRTQRAKPPRRPSIAADATLVHADNVVRDIRITDQSGQYTPSRKRSRPDSTPPTARSATQNRRILVVEDNLVNQKVLCKQLRNRGFLVEAANHGREALEALENAAKSPDDSRFDIILCDIEMPIMGGIECVTEIRRLEGAGIFKGHIPIIGVTANVRSKQVNAAMEVGMDGVTTKPYRIEELIAHIDRLSAEIQNSTTL